MHAYFGCGWGDNFTCPKGKCVQEGQTDQGSYATCLRDHTLTDWNTSWIECPEVPGPAACPDGYNKMSHTAYVDTDGKEKDDETTYTNYYGCGWGKGKDVYKCPKGYCAKYRSPDLSSPASGPVCLSKWGAADVEYNKLNGTEC